MHMGILWRRYGRNRSARDDTRGGHSGPDGHRRAADRHRCTVAYCSTADATGTRVILTWPRCVYRLLKDIRIHQFIPKTAVQPVGVAVPPWAARLDVQCLRASSCQISPDRGRNELRAVVASDVVQRTPDQHHLADQFQRVQRLQAPLHLLQ